MSQGRWPGIGKAWSSGTITLPYYVATGTATSSVNAISVSWPTHQIGDLGILAIETANQPITTVSGWTYIGGIGVGTAGDTTAVAVNVFYRVATSSSESAASVADSGNHTLGVITTYRGVNGTVLDGSVGTGTTASGTSVAASSITTSYANSLVIAVAASGTDTSTPQFSSFTNSNLSSIGIRTNVATSTGNGGALAVADGGLATAGSSGTTTASYSSTKESAAVQFAIRGI